MRLSLRLLSLLPVLLVSAALLLSATLAGCANDVGPGAAELPIVGGTPGGDPAVLWLYNSAEGGLCTGTLIDPRVVLTAKHCVQAAGATGPVRASSMVVGTGDRFGRGTTFTVQSIYTTPGSYTDRGLTGLVGSDVAVLVLASGPSDITPIPIRRTPPTDLPGMTITATGFGQIPSGGAGSKYTATGRVTSVSGDLIYVGTLTCSGDSGGPMVTAENEIAGVVSFGNTETCGTGFGAYNAIYNYLDLIDMAIEEGGGCPGDEMVETLCDGRDNDCDGEVDEPCIPIGEACTHDSECVGNACRATAGGMICTRECNAGRPEIGCGEGFYCSRTAPGACEGWCVPFEGSADLPNDAPCTADAECASYYCADPGDGMRRCLTSCALGDGSCFGGEVCVALAGACGGCVPEEIVTGLAHGLGESCRSSADCAGGAPCFDDEGSQYCTRACDDASACPSGFHCRDAVCVRGTRGGLGDACVSNDDCGGTNPFCAMRGDTSWCTSTCDPADPASCSARFTCVEVGPSISVCVPDGGLLGDPCDAAEDCISGVCSEADSVCVRACGVDAPCGPGFECRRSEDGTAALCVRPMPAPSGGGCAVGIGRDRAGDGVRAMIAALAALAFFAVRRRARA